MKGIFFDFDGTLVQSLESMFHVYYLFLSRRGEQASKIEFEKLNGPPLIEVVRCLKEWRNLPESNQSLLAEYNDLIDESYLNSPPSAGAIKLIHEAVKHSYRLVIVTSNKRSRVEAWLALNGLKDTFYLIIDGEDVRNGKPHPEPYLLALEKSRLCAGNVIAVEDSIQGATSALQAGLVTYLLTETLDIPQEKNDLKCIRSLSDLTISLFSNK
ncbi:HAD-IA family hydrolase [Aeromonas jandaei]|uniref:HAD-IA family hydrolase n=1 Tax=Aeromonas jandaei TaxID=650 RepID=A0ABD7EMU6_AERJA|nr:HAD-IA family hydrolase [Aeromonas jandaei]QWL62492.1 HAD-IA family hydrolase [Aeromonas jandaei]